MSLSIMMLIKNECNIIITQLIGEAAINTQRVNVAYISILSKPKRMVHFVAQNETFNFKEMC